MILSDLRRLATVAVGAVVCFLVALVPSVLACAVFGFVIGATWWFAELAYRFLSWL